MISIDFNGSPITPGVTVVYPTRRGSDMWLSSGTVLEVQHGEYENNGKVKVEVQTDNDGRRVVYVPISRCLVAPSLQLQNTMRLFCEAADKFIGKVDRGEARSQVTYAELTVARRDARRLGFA